MSIILSVQMEELMLKETKSLAQYHKESLWQI